MFHEKSFPVNFEILNINLNEDVSIAIKLLRRLSCLAP
jgi:hypothetical protein